MTIHRRALLAGASGLFLAGCADLVGPPPAPKLYVLAPKFAPQAGASVPFALAVQRPDPSGGLDSERIAIVRPPSGLDFYANAAWSGSVPVLIQDALVEAFEASGRIASVARESDGTRSDVLLNSDLRDFEARYDQGEGAPLAVVRLLIRLVDSRGRRVLASAAFVKEVRASANSVDAAVAALTEAFAGVVAELVPWVLQQNPPR